MYRYLRRARKIGARDGAHAASWYFDGNTTQATYQRVARGIADGDPAILDTFPVPAFEPYDVFDAPGRLSDIRLSAVREAYEVAFTDACHAAIEREAVTATTVGAK